MPSLYVAVYLVRPPEKGHDSEIAAAFYKEAAAFYKDTARSRFPYDVGDDPTFFSAGRLGGPITWGVCRPDVRCPIRKDDGIVFFAEQKDSQDTKTTHYRFVAALRVADKMQHTELWKHPLFSQYLNLVVRPCGVGWEHHEPLWRAGHGDWLWKVTCQSLVKSCRLPRKETKHRDADGKIIRTEKHWEAAGKAHAPGTPLTIDGHAVPVADNYIVFSTSSAVRAHDPPFVALHHKGEKHESWEGDSTSTEIRKLVLRNSGRYLRIPNSLPHRFIRHCPDLKESELEETFRRLRTALKLRSG
jgi:hypothetical protein